MSDITWHDDRNPTPSEGWGEGYPHGLFLVCYRVPGVEEDRYTTCAWIGYWETTDFGIRRQLLHKVVKWAKIR